jgi:DnaJ-class molecular chaperone
MDIDVHIILTPDEAARGGLTVVSVPIYYPCPVCRGSGWDDSDPCQVCDETGAIEEAETVRLPIPPMVGDLDLFEALL